MKNLIRYKNYPVNVTSGSTSFNSFNLNVRDWNLLDQRIDTEIVSLSTMQVLFPKADGTWNRDYAIRYRLWCDSQIPGTSKAVIEEYESTKITGRLSTSLDKWVGFPINTEKMADFSFSPSNVYGTFWVDTPIAPYLKYGSDYWNENYIYMTINPQWRVPVISNIAINQTNVRLPIVVTWSATIQDIFDIEIWQSGIKKYVISGGSEKTATIPANTLVAGAFDTKIISANNPIDDLGVTGTLTSSFTATFVPPVISSLEPNGINQNVNEAIIVTWASTLQDSYTLAVKQNNIVLQTYNGTTAKTVTLPANLASSNTVNLELMVYSTVGGSTVSASKTASFLGYGKPPVPIFGQQSIFNVAKPTFTWTADEQVAYMFEIYKGATLVETTGEKLGSAKSHISANILDNNSDYIIKVKIKNQFNLWSDYATKTISMKYTTLQKPDITTIAGQGAILINANCGQETEFAYAEIWRKTDYVPWARIAMNMGRNISLNDTTVASQTNYSYKIIAYSLSGGAVESDISTNSIDAVLLPFLTIEDIESKESIELPYLKEINFESVRNIVLQNFAGTSRPRIEKGVDSYEQAQMRVLVDVSTQAKLINLLDNAKVLLLRDRIGNKMYCGLSTGISKGGNQYVNYRYITFAVTEVAFLEKDMYSGTQKLVLTYFDGTWKFDGSVNFSGYRYITS